MGKRRKSQSVIDRLPNRKYATVSIPAASTTVAVKEIETNMAARDRVGWLISRFDVQPKGLFGVPGSVPISERFQLCTGAQGALLEIDDDNVIGTIDFSFKMVTEGATAYTWPLSWIGPILISTSKLTCIIDGTDDSAPFQSVDFLFTVWYKLVKIGLEELLEIREAEGIL